MTLSHSETPRPLADVRVLEFCQVAAGPFCGMLLADFGADVPGAPINGYGEALDAHGAAFRAADGWLAP